MKTLLKIVILICFAAAIGFYIYPAEITALLELKPSGTAALFNGFLITGLISLMVLIFFMPWNTSTKQLEKKLQQSVDDYRDKTDEVSELVNINEAKTLKRITSLSEKVGRLEGKLKNSNSILARAGMHELQDLRSRLQAMNEDIKSMTGENSPHLMIAEIHRLSSELDTQISKVEREVGRFDLERMKNSSEDAAESLATISELAAKLPQLQTDLEQISEKLKPLADNTVGVGPTLERLNRLVGQIDSDVREIDPTHFIEQTEQVSELIVTNRHRLDQAARQLEGILKQGTELGSNVEQLRHA